MQIFSKFTFIGIFFLLFVVGCATIPQRKIQLCRFFCDSRSGLYQIKVELFKGVACHCKSGDILWLDMQEDGPFQDNQPIPESESPLLDGGT